MKICKTREDLADLLDTWRDDGERICAVPTMGALHPGHLSLVDCALSQADKAIATIFVNPLQFAPGEDFDDYPRQLGSDAEKLRAQGCDALFAPASGTLFADDFSTAVSVRGVGDGHCAIARPHFFTGVATIVCKLLLLLRPDVAVFGEKDFQQLCVIRRMVRDLEIGVDIVGAPTVRDDDGLAMSSRNQYLSKTQRACAPALYRAINAAARRMEIAGAAWREVGPLTEQMIIEGGFDRVDYVNFVDAETLEMRDMAGPECRILAAARLGKTRLIDNVAVHAAKI